MRRANAIRNLVTAVRSAADRIARDPMKGLPAPRPYPDLARPGRTWVKSGVYWIAYRIDGEPIIAGIFHEAADIPGRADT